MKYQPSTKAAERGEPSYVWRAGQERRLEMIRRAAANRTGGRVLENGCGVGQYLARLAPAAKQAVGLEIEFARALVAQRQGTPGEGSCGGSPLGGSSQGGKPAQVLCGVGEKLPFTVDTFDLVLSHEVIEHVQDDALAVREIVRVLKPGGRLALFCPNRGYPFETHGIYWRGRYHFGNMPLVNWLPRRWRDRLAPHVRVYTRRDLEVLFAGLPVHYVERTVIFGAYDNIIARWPALGRALRSVLQALEQTPLRALGISHFWILEKI